MNPNDPIMSDFESLFSSDSLRFNNYDLSFDKVNEQSNNYYDKWYNATTSLAEKLEAVKANRLEKEYDLRGYRQGYLVFNSDGMNVSEPIDFDGDSGVIEDQETGEKFQYRSHAWNEFDTADFYRDVYGIPGSSRYKGSHRKQKVQPAVVAELNGKKIEELNEYDFKNVERYNFYEFLQYAQDTNYEIQPYNKDVDYGSLINVNNLKIPVLYKRSDVDVYNRYLTRIADPTNGKSIFDELTSNPYMNMRFQLSENVDSEANRERYKRFESEYAEKFVQKADNLRNLGVDPEEAQSVIDNYNINTGFFESLVDRLGFFVDKGQSEAYKIFARMVRRFGGDAVDKEYWKSWVTPGKDGLTYADRIAGVNPARYYMYLKDQEENETLWNEAWDSLKNGDLKEGSSKAVQFLWNSITHIDQLFADSIAQMGAATVGGLLGTALAGPAGGILGVGAGVFTSGLFTALDETLQGMDTYEQNNNGKSMPVDQIMKMFGSHVVAAIPESFLLMLGVGKLLPKKLQDVIFKSKEAREFLLKPSSILGAAGTGAGFEFFQEGFQNFVTDYFARNENDPRSAWEVATDPQQFRAATLGALMGGTLHAGATAIGNVRVNEFNKQVTNLQNQRDEIHSTTSVEGKQLTQEQRTESDSIIARVDELHNAVPVQENIPASTQEEQEAAMVKEEDKIKELATILEKPGISQKAYSHAEYEMFSTIRSIFKRLNRNIKDGGSLENAKNYYKKIANLTGITDDEIMAKNIVRYSDSNSEDLGNTLDRNRRITPQEVQNANQENEEIITNIIGLPKNTTQKIMDEVHDDIDTGAEGISRVTKIVSNARAILNDPNSSDEDKITAKNNIVGSLYSMIRLGANQVDKLEVVAKSVEILANNKNLQSSGKQEYAAGLGEGWNTKRLDVVSDSARSRTVFKLVKQVSEEVKKIQEFLNSAKPEEIKEALQQYQAEVNPKSPRLAVSSLENLFGDKVRNALDRFNVAVDEVLKESDSAYIDRANKFKNDFDTLRGAVLKMEKHDRTDSTRVEFPEYDLNWNTLRQIFLTDKDAWEGIKNRFNQELHTDSVKYHVQEILKRVEQDVMNKNVIQSSATQVKQQVSTLIKDTLNEYTEDNVNSILTEKPTDLTNTLQLHAYKINLSRHVEKLIKAIQEGERISAALSNDQELKDNFTKLITTSNKVIKAYNQSKQDYENSITYEPKPTTEDQIVKNVNSYVVARKEQKAFMYQDASGNNKEKQFEITFTNNKNDPLVQKANNKIVVNKNLERWKESFKAQSLFRVVKFNSNDIPVLKPTNTSNKFLDPQKTLGAYIDYAVELEIQKEMNPKKENESDKKYYHRLQNEAFKVLQLKPKEIREFTSEEKAAIRDYTKGVLNALKKHFKDDDVSNFSKVDELLKGVNIDNEADAYILTRDARESIKEMNSTTFFNLGTLRDLIKLDIVDNYFKLTNRERTYEDVLKVINTIDNELQAEKKAFIKVLEPNIVSEKAYKVFEQSLSAFEDDKNKNVNDLNYVIKKIKSYKTKVANSNIADKKAKLEQLQAYLDDFIKEKDQIEQTDLTVTYDQVFDETLSDNNVLDKRILAGTHPVSRKFSKAKNAFKAARDELFKEIEKVTEQLNNADPNSIETRKLNSYLNELNHLKNLLLSETIDKNIHDFIIIFKRKLAGTEHGKEVLNPKSKIKVNSNSKKPSEPSKGKILFNALKETNKELYKRLGLNLVNSFYDESNFTFSTNNEISTLEKEILDIFEKYGTTEEILKDKTLSELVEAVRSLNSKVKALEKKSPNNVLLAQADKYQRLLEKVASKHMPIVRRASRLIEFFTSEQIERQNTFLNLGNGHYISPIAQNIEIVKECIADLRKIDPNNPFIDKLKNTLGSLKEREQFLNKMYETRFNEKTHELEQVAKKKSVLQFNNTRKILDRPIMNLESIEIIDDGVVEDGIRKYTKKHTAIVNSINKDLVYNTTLESTVDDNVFDILNTNSIFKSFLDKPLYSNVISVGEIVTVGETSSSRLSEDDTYGNIQISNAEDFGLDMAHIKPTNQRTTTTGTPAPNTLEDYVLKAFETITKSFKEIFLDDSNHDYGNHAEFIATMLLKEDPAIALLFDFPFREEPIEDYRKHIEKIDENGNNIPIPSNLINVKELVAGSRTSNTNAPYTEAIKVNKTVALAIDFSARQFFTQDNIMEVFENVNFLTKEELGKLFNIDSYTMSYQTANMLKDMIERFGIPLNRIASLLGEQILNNLGLAARSTARLNSYATLCSTLGYVGLKYCESIGILSIDRYTKEKYKEYKLNELTESGVISKERLDNNSLNDQEHAVLDDTYKHMINNEIHTVRVLKNNFSRFKKFRKSYSEKIIPHTNLEGRTERVSIESVFAYSDPYASKVRFMPKNQDPYRTRYVHHTDKLYKVHPRYVQILCDYENVKYTTVKGVMGFLKESSPILKPVDPNNTSDKRKYYTYAELLAIQQGYLEEDEARDYGDDLERSIEGKNQSIDRSLNFLLNVDQRISDEKDRLLSQKDPNGNPIYTEEELDNALGIYFNYKIIRNSRFMLDSNDVNPQNNKIDRFLCVPESWDYEYDLNKEKDLECIIYATCQAFDCLKLSDDAQRSAYLYLSSLSVQQIDDIMHNMLHIDKFGRSMGKDVVKAIKFKVYDKDGKDTGQTASLGGIENIAQCLVILDSYKSIIEAKSRGETKFHSYMATENDATTSGIDIRLFNSPNKSMIHQDEAGNVKIDAEWYNKLGSFIGDSSSTSGMNLPNMHTIKAQDWYQDVYKSFGKLTNEGLDRLYYTHVETKEFNKNYSSIPKDSTSEDQHKARMIYLITNALYNSQIDEAKRKNNTDLAGKIENMSRQTFLENNADMIEFFYYIESALPKAVNNVVSSELRNLLKYPTMLHNYTAGIKAICNLVSENIFIGSSKYKDSYLKHYLEFMKKQAHEPNLLPQQYDEFAGLKAGTTQGILNTMNFIFDKVTDTSYILYDKDGKPQLQDDGKTIKKAQAQNFKELIANRSLASIYVKFRTGEDSTKTMSITDAFSEAIGSIYGRSIWNSLNDVFKEYEPINNSMNELSAIQYTCFETVLEEKLDELIIKYTPRKADGSLERDRYKELIGYNYIPQKAYNQMLEEIRAIFPGITLAFDTYMNKEVRDEDKGITQLLRYEKSYDDRFSATGLDLPSTPAAYEARKQEIAAGVQNKSGNVVTTTYRPVKLRPQIFGYLPARKGGAVLPIHSTDGMAISVCYEYAYRILDRPITGVHDAVVCSAIDSIELPQVYNYTMLAINENWDMYGTLLDNTLNSLFRYMFKFSKQANVFLKILKEKYNPDNAQNAINTELNNVFSQFLIETKYEESTRGNDTVRYLTNLENWLQTTTYEKKYEIIKSLQTDITESGLFGTNASYYTMYGQLPKGKTSKIVNSKKGDLIENTSENNTNLFTTLENCTKIAEEIKEARKLLYEKFYISNSNMDGAGVSRVIRKPNSRDFINPLEKDNLNVEFISNFINRINNNPNGLQASPNTFTLIGQQTELLNHESSEESYINIINALQALSLEKGLESISNEHFNYLKDLFRGLNLRHLRGFTVKLGEALFNSGIYDPNTKTITVGYDARVQTVDNKRNMSCYSGMDISTVYSHEVIHAVTDFAYQHMHDFNVSDIFYEILKLMKYCYSHNIITAEDFMPSNYDPSLKTIYEKEAIKTYNYIFKNKDYKNGRGLLEFIAYAVTHPKVVEKLRNTNISILPKQTSIFTRIGNLLKEIFTAIKNTLIGSNPDFTNVSRAMGDLFNNKNRYNNLTLLDDMITLVSRLSKADSILEKELTNNPTGIIGRTFTYLRNTLKTWDKWVNSHVFNFLNSKDKELYRSKLFNLLFDPYRKIRNGLTTVSLFDKIKLLPNSILLFMFSKEGRGAFLHLAKNINATNQQGMYHCLLRELITPDDATHLLDTIALYTRSTDQSSKFIEQEVVSDLLSGFTKEDLKYEYQRAATNIALRTDLQALLPLTNSVDEVRDILSNATKQEELINNFKNKINEKINTAMSKASNIKKERLRNWVDNQAYFLAKFMVTGIGCECLNFNAHNIASFNYLDYKLQDYKLHENKDFEEAIDILTTLYAIKISNKDDIAIFNKISDTGISTLLRVHNTYINECKEGVEVTDIKLQTYKNSIFNQDDNGYNDNYISTQIKGYAKEIVDASRQMEVDYTDPAIQKVRKANGWKLEYVFSDKNSDSKYGIYIRKGYISEQRVDGTAYVIEQSNYVGTSMTTMINTMEEENEGRKTLIKEFKRKTTNNHIKLNELMFKKRTPMLEGDIERATSRFLPVPNTKVVAVNEKGEIEGNTMPVTYRYTISNEIKETVLNHETDVTTILSKMYANNNTNASAIYINNTLTRFLVNDMNEHMNPKTHKYNHTGTHDMDLYNIDYVKIEKDSPNEFLKKAYNTLPRQIKEEAKRHGLWVRNDWLVSICGMPNMSLGDTMYNKRIKDDKGKVIDIQKSPLPYIVRKYIKYFEAFLKIVGNQAKKLIVMGLPSVIANNIISNAVLSMINHGSPFKVLKYQLRNIQYTNRYIKDRKELGHLQYRLKQGDNPKNAREEIIKLKTQLNMNPVAPLMQKGMFQNIVEDIREADLSREGKIYKYLNKKGILDKIHTSVPEILQKFSGAIYRNLTLAESSGIYKAMFSITQYSDFIARCTEYQLRMENAPEILYEDGKPIKESLKQYNDYKRNVENYTLNAFINYDKPSSKFEQYLNDMGLLMFTKYAKRITPIISKTILEHPMTVLTYLLSQGLIVNVSDILESNLFNRKWTYLAHNPVDNFTETIIPWAFQVMTGYHNKSLDLNIIK